MAGLPSPDELRVGVRFFAGALRELRRPIAPGEARAALRERLERRADNFLAVAREAIYANSASPYQRLLRRIGCEYGDLEGLVATAGVEGALAALFRQGVYLTVDESKGRVPVVRGSTRFDVDPAGLRHPRVAAGVLSRTSGSRGSRAVVPISFAAMRNQAIEQSIDFDARGGRAWVFARWGVPGSSFLTGLIRYHLAGTPQAAWFSMVDPATAGLHPRYTWSERVLRWAAHLSGVAVPPKRFVPVDDPLPIAHWMVGVLRAARTPCLYSYVTPVVRLCQAAYEAGLDMRGARFAIAG
jgi:hypothetical protein